jgi:hypothetical protein
MIARATARRLRAAIAFATICLLVVGGPLARHHEAEVAHITDASTGITSHALDIDCHDGAPAAHLHALAGDGHADVCGLTAALHQPIEFAKVAPLVTQALIVERATAPPVAHTQSLLLLSAPKTSPPIHSV